MGDWGTRPATAADVEPVAELRAVVRRARIWNGSAGTTPGGCASGCVTGSIPPTPG